MLLVAESLTVHEGNVNNVHAVVAANLGKGNLSVSLAPVHGDVLGRCCIVGRGSACGEKTSYKGSGSES